MAKSKSIKIGIVNLVELSPKRWQLRYRCPSSGRDIRRRLEGLSKTDALSVAATVATSALSQTGYLPGKQEPLPSIHDALAESIRLSRQRPYIRKASCRAAAQFEQWVKDRFRGVSSWDQLQPRMVQTYVVEMEEQGLAPDTVKNRLKPVKAAWRLMAENYPDRVKPLPKIRLATPTPKPIEALSPMEVVLYLDHLKETDRYLFTFETVRFLCGLRILEVAALRIQDLDFEKATLTVAETPHHTPKTKSSFRTIPVPTEALSALREWAAVGSVSMTGELFLNQAGNVWTPDGASSRIKKAMKAAAAAIGVTRLGEVQPHCLRASCASMAARLGCPDGLVKKYLGHTGADILTRHYQAVDLSDLRSVSSRLDGWRSLILEPESGNILAIEKNEGSQVLDSNRVNVA